MRRSITILCCLLAVIFAASGCVVHQMARVTYRPETIQELTRLKPVTVRLQVIDARPAAERSQVSRSGKVVFVTERDASVILQDAIQAGLEQHGHRVVLGTQEAADAEIMATLTRFYVETKSTTFTIVKTASVQAEVTVGNPGEKSRDSVIRVRGANEKVYPVLGSALPHEPLSEAFSDAVNQLLIDQRFLATIERASDAR